jgi:ABC-type transport system involved in cytochrome c biogenesis permease component
VNPILSREIRARFRDKRSFWLLLGLSLLLCLTAGWIYQEAVLRAELQDRYVSSIGPSPSIDPATGLPFVSSFQERASQTGRELFRSLAIGNVLIWLLVAPALTATGLCKERERGLLESLWLSPFRVRDQIVGRFLASLLFLFELQLVALPVYGIAVMLGGVSPQEILGAGAIIAMTAFGGAALGLWCSSRSYRPAGAMGSAIGIVTVGALVAFFLPDMFRSTFGYMGWDWTIQALEIMRLLQPLYLAITIIQGNDRSLSYLVSQIDGSTLTVVSLLVQFLLSVLLLSGTVRNAAKPLPEAAWLGRNPFFERWRRGLERRKAERLERQEAAKMSEKVGGALLYEVPFEKLARFRDPLLRREVRGRFRLRQSGIVIALMRLAALFIIVVTWLFMLSTLFDSRNRDDAAGALIVLLWVLGLIGVGILSSTSFTGERESGTWEGLQLSLLTIREIVVSKWSSPLVTYFYWSAPLWIWLPFCVRVGGGSGMPFWSLLAAISAGIVSLGAATAWGLFVSSRAPHSAAATSWTLATLLIFLVGTPILVETLRIKPKITSLVYGMTGGYGYDYSSSYGYPDYNGGSNFSHEAEAGMQQARRIRQFQKILDSYHPFNVITMEFEEPNAGASISGYQRFYPDKTTKLWGWAIYCFEGIGLIFVLLKAVSRRMDQREV